MGKLFGIQYLRAIAALAVVCFHAASKEGSGFIIGEAGVDVFFVISGFLMVAITNEKTSPVQFLGDRIRRIVPVYWIATTVMLIGVIVGLFPNARLETWHIAASYFFLPAQSPTSEYIWPLLVPGWTLNYEMTFYAVFALTLLVRQDQLRILLLTAILLVAVSVGLIVEADSVAGRFYTHQIVLEFAVGCWLGYFWKHHRNMLQHGPILAMLSLAGFVAAWIANSDENRALVYGIPSLLLVAGVLAFEHREPIRRWPAPLLLGNASYSIYIWHTLAISVTSKAGSVLGMPTAATIALNIVGGVVIGLIAYAAVERPLIQALARKKGNSSERLNVGVAQVIEPTAPNR